MSDILTEVPMDTLWAVNVCEGVEEADEATQLRCWQHLHDTRIGYQLQGYFGRTLVRLIENGHVKP